MLSLLKRECHHLLCHSSLIMTRSPFSNAVTFEKHNLTLVSYHHWRRIQGNNRADTAHLQHIASSPRERAITEKLLSHCHNLPAGLWRWDVHIWSSFLALLQWDAVSSDYGGRWGGLEEWPLFIYFKDKKKKRGDWNALPPTELHLANGPWSADKLILEIRGHFLCLLTWLQHAVVSRHPQRANTSGDSVILAVIVTISDLHDLWPFKSNKIFQPLSVETHIRRMSVHKGGPVNVSCHLLFWCFFYVYGMEWHGYYSDMILPFGCDDTALLKRRFLLSWQNHSSTVQRPPAEGLEWRNRAGKVDQSRTIKKPKTHTHLHIEVLTTTQPVFSIWINPLLSSPPQDVRL